MSPGGCGLAEFIPRGRNTARMRRPAARMWLSVSSRAGFRAKVSGMRRQAAILSAAFLSGAGALALQLTWSRRLAIGLGHETPAVLGVVTAFFAGLALGGWAGARWVGAGSRPGRLAAWVEGGVAAWAVATVPLLSWTNGNLPGWRGVGSGAAWGWALAFGVPLLALLPATVLVGATFPVLERWLAVPGNPGHVGRYYAVNTAGAVAGVVLALGWAQPALGFPGTTWLAAAFHAVAALVFLLADRGVPAPADAAVPSVRGGLPRGTHALLAAAGLLGIGFEVVAMRLLAMALGGTVYSAATTLGLWLLGTALGAAAWTRWRGVAWDRLPWAVVVAVVASSWGLSWMPAWLEGRRAAWGTDFMATSWAELLGAAFVLLPVTLLLGAWFPQLVTRVVQSGHPSGRAVAANTLGGMLAPLAFGAGLFPLAGGRGSMGVLVAGYALLAGWAAPWGRGRRTPGGRWAVAGAVALAGWALLPRDLTLLQGPPGARRVWVREEAGDTTAVWEFPDGNRSLAVNNRFAMGGTAGTNAASRHAHLPLLLHPAPRRAAFLGLGTGLSFAAAGAHPGLTADGVELVPGVAAALGEFAPYNRLRPGLDVVVADARTFMRSTPNRYDVVVADLFHPDRDGAGWLYTREHFAAIRSRLAPGGIACQWLPWFQLDASARDLVVRAWEAEFPGSEAWMLRWTTVDTPVVGLVGRSAGSGAPVPRPLAGLDDGLRGRLRECGLGDDWQVWGCWLGPVTGLFSPTPVDRAGSTDEQPSVGWLAARNADRARRRNIAEWLQMLDRVSSVPAPAWPGVDAARWARFRTARDEYVRALAATVEGRTAEAEAGLWRSAGASADFPSAYSHLLGESMAEMRSRPESARSRLRRLADLRPEKPVAQELMRRMETR